MWLPYDGLAIQIDSDCSFGKGFPSRAISKQKFIYYATAILNTENIYPRAFEFFMRTIEMFMR